MRKPNPRAPRIGRLNTVLEVAAELGKVYRDARHSKIDSALGSRLANILSAMRQCLETAMFEQRIAQLELAVTRSTSRFAPLDDPVRRDPVDKATEEEETPSTNGSDRRH